MGSGSRAEYRRQESGVRISDPAICYITLRGRRLAERLKTRYPRARISKFSPGEIRELWLNSEALVFIMAAGIVVRTIAPLLKDKKTDPAVIVLDEAGKYAISLLSGHLGGANDRAREIAHFLGGEAIITTASDVNGLTSIDLWAIKHGLVIEDWDALPRVGTHLVDKGSLTAYTDTSIAFPPEFRRVDNPGSADLLVTNRIVRSPHGALYLRPKNIVLGIGCNRGTSAGEIEAAVKKALNDHGFSFQSVQSVATIDMKAAEPGIRKFCRNCSFDLHPFSAAELNSVAGVATSEAAFKATGARAVAEPAALLAAGEGKLLMEKQKIGNVTVAAAEMGKTSNKGEQNAVNKSGKIYVVGTGPGDISHITPHALKAIRGSDIIVGYGTYIDLINDLVRDKEVFSTGMTQEIDRCRKAVELARGGKTVAVISGGDPGIYAMAGLVFELLRDQEAEDIRDQGRNASGSPLNPRTLESLNPVVEVIPGISALNACAARLGAPLMHDFASISLSDRLTPWEIIEKRLDAAALADFVIVLYNPKSKGRAEHISRAREIVMKYRRPETPVGIVRAAMRENEVIVVTDLEHMLENEIDMQTSVVIGNANTVVWNNLMITPRGYEKKKQYHTKSGKE